MLLKKLKKASIITLSSCLILSQLSATVLANSPEDTSAESTTIEEASPRINVPWGKLIWGILAHGSQFFITGEGTAEDTTTYTYRSSPAMWFNDPVHGTAGLAEHQLNVYAPGTFLVHGHRASVVPTGNLQLSIIDPKGNYKKTQVCGSNQYMDYVIPTNALGPYGVYRCQYVATNGLPQKWQLYARFMFDPNFEWRSAREMDGYYYSEQGKVYQYSDSTPISYRSFINKDQSLTAKQFNDQFINPGDGAFVDYLKDYDPGDKLYLSDEITMVEYILDENATSISFDGPGGEQISWIFSGDLTSDYTVGDTLNLHFNVVQSEQSENHVFESTDYSIEAEKLDNGYPEISDYLN